ncbi:hypothetical protein D3C71_2049880 [compost metagenome]
MASICNAEGACLGGMSGHAGFVRTFSGQCEAEAHVAVLPGAVEPGLAPVQLGDLMHEVQAQPRAR